MDHHGTESQKPHTDSAAMARRGGGMVMDHDRMMREEHERTLWTHFSNMTLGAWLIASPVSFGYQSTAVGRSDIVTGGLIVILSALSISPERGWPRWANCFAGIWLLFAPLVFWAPTAAAYTNDTLIGALVIAFAILVPGMPGMSMEAMMSGPDVPPGWTYNPSSWLQRAPLIGLAIVSFLLSRYLTAHQLGYIQQAWDPFFGDGTRRVLNSEVSRAWPISDAGLGALTYVLEALSGFMGDRRRWRTMPWMVLMFFVLVVPLGITSIVLVMLQPVAVGTWCTICLATAALMLIMIPLAVDEVVAMGQFLAQIRREGKPLWTTFWRGGTLEGNEGDLRTPDFHAPLGQTVPATAWGVTAPWTLLVSAALGIWMLVAPAVLQIQGAAANSSYIAGALITTFAVLAMAEVTRAARFLNLLVALWVLASPWILAGATAEGRWNGVAVGILLVIASLPRGKVKERYGHWDAWVV